MSTAPNHVSPRTRKDRIIVYARISTTKLSGLCEQIQRCLGLLTNHAAGVQVIGSVLPATAVDPALATAIDGNIDLIMVENLDRLPVPQRRRLLQAVADGEYRLVAVGDQIDSAKSSH